MKIAQDFIIQEFVPKSIYKKFGKNSIWFVDPYLIKFCQWLRDYTQAPITINDWHRGGNYSESGLRDPLTSTGAKYSQHKFGKAVDIKVAGHLPETVREIIRENFSVLRDWYGITTIEKDTPTWTHVDTRYTGLDELLQINYK